MPRTRIKICGITRPEDAELAAELGADFVGLNFVGGPRKITISRAASILRVIHPPLVRVGLAPFDMSMDYPHQLDDVRTLDIEVFQVYADRIATAPRWFSAGDGGPQWWAVRHIDSMASLKALAEEWSHWPERRIVGCFGVGQEKPSAFVLDTAVKGQLGGTGQSFNWHWIAEARAAGELNGLPPIILAGGLNPDNVADAIRIARPWAVDVSSGVEVPGQPGVKDPSKMRDFIQAVRAADAALAD
jgi:phosphoribosylanthranilate isomerase